MNISKTHNISTLKKREEIKYVLDNSKKIYTRLGVIFLQHSDNNDEMKVAILVKKSCGSSVKRNYVKRIIRHFVRDHYRFLKNYNRIIFLYNSREDTGYHKLKDIFLKALS